jgi:hypothetical protein
MKYLKLNEIKPGMITAREVQDVAGNTLLKADAELTERAIQAVVPRGVDGIWIKTEDEILTPEQVEDARRKLAEHVAAMFRDRLDDEIMNQIMRAAFRIRDGKLGK